MIKALLGESRFARRVHGLRRRLTPSARKARHCLRLRPTKALFLRPRQAFPKEYIGVYRSIPQSVAALVVIIPSWSRSSALSFDNSFFVKRLHWNMHMQSLLVKVTKTLGYSFITAKSLDASSLIDWT